MSASLANLLDKFDARKRCLVSEEAEMCFLLATVDFAT